MSQFLLVYRSNPLQIFLYPIGIVWQFPFLDSQMNFEFEFVPLFVEINLICLANFWWYPIFPNWFSQIHLGFYVISIGNFLFPSRIFVNLNSIYQFLVAFEILGLQNVPLVIVKFLHVEFFASKWYHFSAILEFASVTFESTYFANPIPNSTLNLRQIHENSPLSNLQFLGVIFDFLHFGLELYPCDILNWSPILLFQLLITSIDALMIDFQFRIFVSIVRFPLVSDPFLDPARHIKPVNVLVLHKVKPFLHWH